MKLLSEIGRYKAQRMRKLVHEGNNLYDVIARNYDDSMTYLLSQGPTAEDVEMRVLNDAYVRAVVARKIVFDD